MNIGIDIGYSSVKAVGGPNRPVAFPTMADTPDQLQVALGSADDHAILDLTSDEPCLIGEGVFAQSRLVDREEDRDWIASDA